jgi:hypothetical protein
VDTAKFIITNRVGPTRLARLVHDSGYAKTEQISYQPSKTRLVLHQPGAVALAIADRLVRDGDARVTELHVAMDILTRSRTAANEIATVVSAYLDHPYSRRWAVCVSETSRYSRPDVQLNVWLFTPTFPTGSTASLLAYTLKSDPGAGRRLKSSASTPSPLSMLKKHWPTTFVSPNRIYQLSAGRWGRMRAAYCGSRRNWIAKFPRRGFDFVAENVGFPLRAFCANLRFWMCSNVPGGDYISKCARDLNLQNKPQTHNSCHAFVQKLPVLQPQVIGRKEIARCQ